MGQPSYQQEVVKEAFDDENSKSENLNNHPKKLNPFNTTNYNIKSFTHHRPSGNRATMNLS